MTKTKKYKRYSSEYGRDGRLIPIRLNFALSGKIMIKKPSHYGCLVSNFGTVSFTSQSFGYHFSTKYLKRSW
jgi:hypothetical protein